MLKHASTRALPGVMDIVNHSNRRLLLRVVQQDGALGGHGQEHAALDGEGGRGPARAQRVRARGPPRH